MSRTCWLWLYCVSVTTCGGSASPVADPIPDVPPAQQRIISRNDFRDEWPFEPGTGTLGCAAGAVVFRVQGVTYALNEPARARGYASVDALVGSQSRQPSRPLKRITQDERMRIFRTASACAPADAGCRQRVAVSSGLSPEELTQIEAEGRERSWPPLSPPLRSTSPVVNAGLALCSR